MGLLVNAMKRDTRADWSEAFELVPSLQVAYVWHASVFAHEVLKGLLRIGFLYPQQIIWNKGRMVLTRTHYWYQHEPCLYMEWARCSTRYCDWAKAYYDNQRARGKSAQVAIRSLAFKWTRIVFRLWRDRKPFEAEVYRKVLASRQSATKTNPIVQMQWKKVAGFSKIAGVPLD
jgi:hypothetical protein